MRDSPSLNDTPSADRTHIVIIGRRNSGKSSLINALANQNAAIVSDAPGTTTDPVRKAMEIAGIGACMLIDTAGMDDDDPKLGAARIEKTRLTAGGADIAVIVFSATDFFSPSEASPRIDLEKQWADLLKRNRTPVITVLNKIDSASETTVERAARVIASEIGSEPIRISALRRLNINLLFDALAQNAPQDDRASITGDLVGENDLALLVMPQDIQAPKGRLILPQTQTIRELLDRGAVVVACTFDKLKQALDCVSKPPKLIITDSQVFKEVENLKPRQSMLTSFSVLFARYKGDEKAYKAGADAIDALTPESAVLIAECCTHRPLNEDIGRVKLPRLFRARIGEKITVDFCAGIALPDDLSPYSLIVQCGGCMFTRAQILARINRAREQNVPITNYGMAIAKLTGTTYV